MIKHMLKWNSMCDHLFHPKISIQSRTGQQNLYVDTNDWKLPECKLRKSEIWKWNTKKRKKNLHFFLLAFSLNLCCLHQHDEEKISALRIVESKSKKKISRSERWLASEWSAPPFSGQSQTKLLLLFIECPATRRCCWWWYWNREIAWKREKEREVAAAVCSLQKSQKCGSEKCERWTIDKLQKLILPVDCGINVT